MKDFIKKNLVVIILFLIAVVCYALVVVSTVFLPIAAFFTGVPMIILAINSKKKYNRLSEESKSNKQVFDATDIDYDEDVYYIGTSQNKKEIKGIVSRFNALSPVIICWILAVSFLFFSFISAIDLFL